MIPCDSAMPPRNLSRGQRDKIPCDSAMPPRDLSRGRRLCRRNTAKPPLAYNNTSFYRHSRKMNISIWKLDNFYLILH